MESSHVRNRYIDDVCLCLQASIDYRKVERNAVHVTLEEDSKDQRSLLSVTNPIFQPIHAYDNNHYSCADNHNCSDRNVYTLRFQETMILFFSFAFDFTKKIEEIE